MKPHTLSSSFHPLSVALQMISPEGSCASGIVCIHYPTLRASISAASALRFDATTNEPFLPFPVDSPFAEYRLTPPRLSDVHDKVLVPHRPPFDSAVAKTTPNTLEPPRSQQSTPPRSSPGSPPPQSPQRPPGCRTESSWSKKERSRPSSRGTRRRRRRSGGRVAFRSASSENEWRAARMFMRGILGLGGRRIF